MVTSATEEAEGDGGEISSTSGGDQRRRGDGDELADDGDARWRSARSR